MESPLPSITCKLCDDPIMGLKFSFDDPPHIEYRCKKCCWTLIKNCRTLGNCEHIYNDDFYLTLSSNKKLLCKQYSSLKVWYDYTYHSSSFTKDELKDWLIKLKSLNEKIEKLRVFM